MSLNCSDGNVIYVAECNLCSSGIYFGQTWLPLNIRVNNHRPAFKTDHYNKSYLTLHNYNIKKGELQPLNIRVNNHRAAFKTDHYNKSSLALHFNEMHSDSLADKLSNFNIGIVRKSNRDDLNMDEMYYI